MADVNKTVNFRFKSTSDLPEITKQLDTLIQLSRNQEAAVAKAQAAYAAQTKAIIDGTAAAKAQGDAILFAQTMSLAQTNQNIAAQKQLLTAQGQTTAAIQAQGKAAQDAAAQQAKSLGDIAKATSSLESGFTNLRNLIGLSLSVSAIKSFSTEMIEAKSKLDFFKTGLDNMIGSERIVAEVYGDLVRVAKTTPFSMDDLTKVTLTLSAMGVETAKLVPTIESLGDVAAIVGSDKLPRIAKAYTDVMNKGVLMKQEINQFAENSVPIYDLLAVSMGKTRDQVVKLAEDHKIGFAEVEKAFKVATQEGGKYFNMAITQSQTLGGRMKNLEDSIMFAKAAAGDFFEKELSNMIDGFYDWTEAIGGTQAAISRTVDVVKAIAAAVITYTGVTKGALIIEEARNIMAGAWAVAMRAAQVAQAAYTLTVITATGTTEGFTRAQLASAAALRASPWGAIAALVGVATVAYYAFSAATTEVTSLLGEEEITLKNSQKAFNDAVARVTLLAEGTEKRTAATKILMAQYPEYFKGLSAESLNNQTLNKILMQVNDSYADRIELARNAYKIDELTKQRTQLLKEENDLMERIKMRSPELYKQVQGDSEKLYAVLKKGGAQYLADLDNQGSMLANFWDNTKNITSGGMLNQAATISKGLKDIDKQLSDSSAKRITLSENEVKSAVTTENERWNLVSKGLKKGTDEYRVALADHEKKIREINKETSEYKIKLDGDDNDKKKKSLKTSLELSLENQVQEIKGLEKTYENKLKLIDAEEKLDIERAKRTITNKKDQIARIESIEMEAINKRNTLMAKEIDKQIDYDMKEQKQVEKNIQKIIELKQKEADQIEDLTNFVNGLQEKQRQENLANAEKASKRLVDLAQKVAEEAQKYGERDAVENKKFWQTKQDAAVAYWAKIKQEEIAGYEAQQVALAAHIEKMAQLYGTDSSEYLDGLGDMTELVGKLNKAKAEQSQAQDEMSASAMNWAATIVKIAQQIFQSIYDAQMAVYEQLDKGYEVALSGMEKLKDLNSEYLSNMADDSTKTYEELSEAYRVMMSNNASIEYDMRRVQEFKDSNLAMMDELENGFAEVSSGFSAITSALNGDIGSTIGSLVDMFVNMSASWDQENAKQEARHSQKLSRMWQESIDRHQMEIEAEQLLLRKKFELWDEEMAKFREDNNTKISEAQKYWDTLNGLATQYSQDSQLRLLNDQNYRNQLLAEGEAREIQALNDAKARQLQYASEHNASEAEMAAIAQSFDQLITEKHKEYADARGNKDKEISLASKEVKADETDFIKNSETELANVVAQLKAELAQKEAQLGQDKKNAQADYVAFVMQSNQAIWDNQKAMAIQDLKTEIAILKSKRNLFNKGKINDAIGDLEAAIREIDSMSNPYAPQPPVTPSTRPSTTGGVRGVTTDPGSGGTGNPVTNTGDAVNGPRTGGARYHGDEDLKPRVGEVFGRDSIKIMANYRERIIPSEDNIRLINHTGGVRNKELVNGYIEMHKMKKSNPELFKSGKFDPAGLNVLSGLPGLMSMNYTKMQTLGVPTMNFDTKEIVEAIKSTGKRPLLHVNVSPYGTTTQQWRDGHNKNYLNHYKGKI